VLTSKLAGASLRHDEDGGTAIQRALRGPTATQGCARACLKERGGRGAGGRGRRQGRQACRRRGGLVGKTEGGGPRRGTERRLQLCQRAEPGWNIKPGCSGVLVYGMSSWFKRYDQYFLLRSWWGFTTGQHDQWWVINGCISVLCSYC